MTKKKGLPSKFAQVGYDHKKMDQQLLKVKSSTEELQVILEHLNIGKKKK